MNKSYTTFLESADLKTWESALQSYDHLLGDKGQINDVSITELAEGLILSTYVVWLSDLQGETGRYENALHIFRQLFQLTGQLKKLKTVNTRLVEAIIAGSCGYCMTAQEIVKNFSGDIPIEVRLMMLPQSPSKKAQIIKDQIFLGDEQPSFLPAVYFYCHALLELGYYQEVRNQVEKVKRIDFKSNGLVIDLQAKLLEFAGNWEKAAELYGRSEWAIHRYRYILCQNITAGSGQFDLNGIDLGSDQKFIIGMRDFKTETDPVDLARSNMFINTCRWHGFENWLVQFELGKVSFQQRRHLEAEKHFKLAVENAPTTTQLPINNLRFSNLTWFRGSIVRDLSIEAETLECAQAVLDSGGKEAEKVYAREYLARRTNSNSLLTPIFETDNEYAKGLAYRRLEGHQPLAMASWVKALNQSYLHRAWFELIYIFTDLQFAYTVEYIIDIVFRESWEDFAQLWELGDCLIIVFNRTSTHFTVRQIIGDKLEELDKRIRVLCQMEFQNLMRAFEFYIKYRRPDIAGDLLRRAATVAERPDEYLELAIARRNVAWFALDQQDMLGLGSLLRAEREASHRLEKLLIARELVKSGQFPGARNILTSIGLFEQDKAWEPIEYIVALQCGQPCLTKQEIIALGEDAAHSLKKDIASGRFAKYAQSFIRRLEEYATVSLDNPFDYKKDQFELIKRESLWQEWKVALEEGKKGYNLVKEEVLLREKIEELQFKQTEYLYAYTMWKYVLNNYEEKLDEIMNTRPNLDDSETSISKSGSIVSNERAHRLARLWKEYLIGENEEHLNAIKAFTLEEKRLTENWESLRKKEMEQALRRAHIYVRSSQTILEIIKMREEIESPWPFFLDIQDHILLDIQQLSKRLDRQMNLA